MIALIGGASIAAPGAPQIANSPTANSSAATSQDPGKPRPATPEKRAHKKARRAHKRHRKNAKKHPNRPGKKAGANRGRAAR